VVGKELRIPNANWKRKKRNMRRSLRSDDGSPKHCHPHMFRDTFAVEMRSTSESLGLYLMQATNGKTQIAEASRSLTAIAPVFCRVVDEPG
jgi:site-specific recombinase XerC